jgi:hypothetical protein
VLRSFQHGSALPNSVPLFPAQFCSAKQYPALSSAVLTFRTTLRSSKHAPAFMVIASAAESLPPDLFLHYTPAFFFFVPFSAIGIHFFYID